jgi:dephospho-CoA kinase
MLLVGLTGGIGAGKSTVAARFAELGAHIIDADQLARDAVAPGTIGLALVVAAFGSEILDSAGSLDRAALGAIVFADPEARTRLEDIVHPEVSRLSSEAIARWRATDPTGIVVYDIPLLVESKNVYAFDAVVVLAVPNATRIERLVSLRGMSHDEALRRVESQATEEQRLARADYVIDSSTSLENTLAQVDTVWSQLQTRNS